MNIMKLAVIKCLTALILGMVMVTTLVAYAASGSQNEIMITDGEKTFGFTTYCQTAEEILSDADITLLSGDEVDLQLENGMGSLTVYRAFPVYITVGDDTVMLNMARGTVADALERAGIALGEYDICNMSLDTVLTGESYIDIVSVGYTTASYEEVIPFTTKVEYSASLAKGEEKIVTNGVNGLKTVTVKQKIENGVVTGTEVVSSVVTKEAVAQTKLIGTKTASAAKKPSAQTSASSRLPSCISTLTPPASLTLNANGIPTSYTKSMTFRASAYTSSSGAKCSTGVRAQPGYIAVNPSIIPYGTKMYIVSNDGKYVYGYAIAADTGGFAKRNPYMVDLYFPTESQCNTFGIRNVTIYFLS